MWTDADADAARQALTADLRAVLDRAHPAAVAVLHDGEGPVEKFDPLIPGVDRSQWRWFDVAPGLPALHVALCCAGPYDVLIDATRQGAARPKLFRATFSHLRAGGHWITLDVTDPVATEAEVAPAIRAADPHLWPYLAQLIRRRDPEVPVKNWRERDQARMSTALGRVVVGERHLVVGNRLDLLAKLRDDEVNTVLAALGPEAGELVARRPASTFDAAAALITNLAPREVYHQRFEVPALNLREYRDVRCVSGGAVLQGRRLLPESYRHHRYPRLQHKLVPSFSHNFARPPVVKEVRRLEGPWFYLDGEYREHFGHFLSEQVSRLWGWDEAAARHPDLRLLLGRRSDRSGPAGFQRELLAAYGIPADRIETITVGEAVDVELLVGVTPMYSMPDYVHPGIAKVWSRIGDALAAQVPATPTPARLFVDRPPDSARPCTNADQVRELFLQRGFEAVKPELLSLPEQVHLFRQAEAVAGFGGSGMMGLLWCERPIDAITIGPHSFTPNNEYLISSVRGHRLTELFSVPADDHPDGGWSREAFYSGFTFDLGREGRDLRSFLDRLDGIEPVEPEVALEPEEPAAALPGRTVLTPVRRRVGQTARRVLGTRRWRHLRRRILRQ